MAATEVNGLVIEYRRKIASFDIGAPVPGSRWPRLSKYAILPLRATRTTAPGYRPRATSAFSTWVTRASLSEESPTSSGFAVASASAQTRDVKTIPRSAAMRDASLAMASLLEERGKVVRERYGRSPNPSTSRGRSGAIVWRQTNQEG